MHPYHDTLIRPLRDVDTVIGAGANISPMCTALRARIDGRADAETMLQRYTTALLTGQGDLTALRAGALAEVTAGGYVLPRDNPRQGDQLSRQQRPPQIKVVEVLDRKTGKKATRYELVADAGVNAETGKRSEIRRRFATEKAAKDELAKLQNSVTTTPTCRSRR